LISKINLDDTIFTLHLMNPFPDLRPVEGPYITA
jgi:hypothetical protein